MEVTRRPFFQTEVTTGFRRWAALLTGLVIVQIRFPASEMTLPDGTR